jgi:hypothetical protein
MLLGEIELTAFESPMMRRRASAIPLAAVGAGLLWQRTLAGVTRTVERALLGCTAAVYRG